MNDYKEFLEEQIKKKIEENKNKFNKIESLLSTWEDYRNKINSDSETLKLKDYTNRIENSEEYLTHFLNLTAREFGRSREGNTNQLMLQLNSDNKTYYLGKMGNASEKENTNEDEANAYFNEYILPLLKKIISLQSIKDISDFENNNVYFKDFVCKQMLRKILVLESLRDDCCFDFKNKLLHIYKKEAIDFLIRYFDIDDSNVSSYSEKGYLIICKCYDILGYSEPTKENVFYLSKVLWDIYASRDLTSIEQPNIILYGAPGTGKTFEVLNNIKVQVKDDSDRYVYIQCHPGFGYDDFIEGIKPIGVTDNGSIRFSIVNGLFKELCIRAKNHPENIYYFIADEINRTDISTMFGETLSLIETSYRDNPNSNNFKDRHLLRTQLSNVIAEFIEKGIIKEDDISKYAYEYQNKTVYFGIPKNIRFIGMMNDVDKSIDTFDLALRRRFARERKDYDPNVITDYLLGKEYPEEAVTNYVERCNRLNDFIASSKNNGLGLGINYKFGHSYFFKIELFNNPKKTKNYFKNLDILFDKYLSFILKEYIRSFKEEDEIDDYLKKAKKLFCE